MDPLSVPYMQSTRNYSSSRARQSRDSGGNAVAASMLVSSSDKHSRQSEFGSMAGGGKVNGMSMMMPATTRNSTSTNKLNRSALIPGGGLQFGSANKLTKSSNEPVIKPPKNKKESENFDELPMEFTVVHRSQFNEDDSCEYCPTVFSLIKKRHHCRVCGVSICSSCEVKRRLSKTDSEAYPVCIKCDFNLTNSYQLRLFNEVVSQREELIEQVQQLVEQGEVATKQLNNKKEEKKTELYRETKRLDQELKLEREKITDLEYNTNQIQEDIQIKSNNLNKLKHESAELKHEVESKKLQIESIRRQMGRVD